jgi:hypothetical protein
MPSIWHAHEGTDLTQNEVITLEEVGFLLSKKLRCQPRNLFGGGAFIPMNKPTNAYVWPKIQNGKNICRLSILKLSIQQHNKWEVNYVFVA